jgi:hypothetical protein
MRIENLFEKSIFRPINGVVKADQMDDASVWQELDEFVITRELNQHLMKFFSQYGPDNAGDADAAGRIGVWISGFFGSGKSHLIKVLSYLLENREHAFEGNRKLAFQLLEPKIKDAMLLGDVQRALGSRSDVVLFNIESKVPAGAGREAILSVFLNVLNKLEGFCEDYPHIAHMERHLSGKGKYQLFMDYYQDLTRTQWVDERDAYQFNRDHVVGALAKTLGQSRESAEKWVDGAEESFTLTVEKFAQWTKEYLDARGPRHRLVFLVDEVGQFIGTDTHLMLSLQTLVEELGVVCKGRAWVIVTSQEDIDAVLGEIQGTRANDFSKIQGRFKTRLSLSSANIDEVLQERLLKKREEVNEELEQIWVAKGDIIKNQLTFKNVGTTFRQTKDAAEFAQNYPFAPYQFQLVQKIFEAIRKAGATGLHLSRGERSLLDAFQAAAKAVAQEEVGVAVPLYRFYPSIESFLDTAVSMTIKQAADNPALELPFDVELLRVLFLIRYVDEMKGNIDNLVTLCLDTVDADRLALRRKIEASLARLEKETLISRSGENYLFLSNEEQDINREIKNVELGGGEEEKLLGEIIFGDLLRDQRKHRYLKNKMDFPFNRFCDSHPVGNRVEGALAVSAITPLAEDYDTYTDARCILDSSQENGQVVIRLDDHSTLERELRAWLRTDKYLRTRDDGTLAPTTRRIHKDLADDNRIRRENLTETMRTILTGSRWFAAGERVQVKSSTPTTALDEALEYLIENTFHKMKLLDRLLGDGAIKEIQAVLRSGDVAQQKMAMTLPESNPLAIAEVRNYVELCDKASRPIVLFDLLNGRFASRPYGWPPMETLLLLARLHAVGEVKFALNHTQIADERVYEQVTTQSQWRKITVLRRRTADPQAVQKARQLGKDVFSEMGPDGEDPIVSFLRDRCSSWKAVLAQYKSLADTGKYPGATEIDDGLALLRAILAAEEGSKFIERFLEWRDELLELADHFRDLQNFYERQRPIWERLRAAADRFKLNDMELQRDADAADVLRRISEILQLSSPYGVIQETDGLIARIEKVNESLLALARQAATGTIDAQLAAVSADLDRVALDAATRGTILQPLQRLREGVQKQTSLAHLGQAESEAVRLKDQALVAIEKYLDENAATATPGTEPKLTIKKPRVIKPATLVKSGYLETRTDVDEFIEVLRSTMEQALANDERIEIR